MINFNTLTQYKPQDEIKAGKYGKRDSGGNKKGTFDRYTSNVTYVTVVCFNEVKEN